MEGTEDSRAKKLRERQTAREVNNQGKRLEWARICLGLLQKEVALEIGISLSTYSGRESNVRTGMQEELLAIAVYLDRHWQARYSKHNAYPMFQGREIKEISIFWLQFGFDPKDQEAEEVVLELKRKQVALQESIAKAQEAINPQLKLFPKESA